MELKYFGQSSDISFHLMVGKLRFAFSLFVYNKSYQAGAFQSVYMKIYFYNINSYIKIRI
jgi:hypothetical protein